ncbi:MAG: hypothetical protein LUC43_01460 [Burkholderiales bacterium]|nr:hypothetical protein [Burkholderiales bacterium]
MTCATLAKCQYDAEQEKLKEAADRTAFPVFEEQFNQAVGEVTPPISSDQLFDFYRCASRSITEKAFCNRKTDEVLNQLTQEQREALLPLLKESFTFNKH